MILWFGKKKKKQELEEAGAAMEAEAPAADAAVETELENPPPPAEEVLAQPAEGGAAEADLTEPDASDPISEPEPAADDAPSAAPSERFAPTSPASGGGETATDSSAEPESDPVAETKQPSFFARMSKGLLRSSSRLGESITGVFTKRKLDDDTLEELEDLLIASDLGAGVAARVTAGLAKDRFDKEVTDEEIKQALADEITAVLSPREQVVDFSDGPRPRIVLFVGVNGSGKTTTIGKIASKLKDQGAKALLVAGDTFRAAAIEQLTVWGDRAGIPVLSKPTGADAAGLVYEAVERAQREDLDLVLVDTAGRLQNKSELMAELAKIIRVTRKLDPEAPHDVILVLDATVGQNALSQVEAFRHTAGVTGLVMTKLDGTAKGGVLVAIADKHDLPIHFIGVGEKAEDLQPFSAEGFAKALVGLDA